MMKTHFLGRVTLALAVVGPLFAAPIAMAQQDPGFFVPPGGQRPQGQPQRPPQGQPSAQRPPQGQPQPGQRPPGRTEAPTPLPPGQQPPAAVIGIVDIPEVQRVSAAFNQVREEIERRRTRLNDELQREQNGWREAQQALAGERAGLQAEVLRLRERELQDRITDSQRIFRNRSQAIEQAAQAALVEIEQGLGTVIRLVAQSRNVNIMLPRPLVIMNEPAFDLTEEIAQQFNRNLPRVTIQPESDGRNPPAPPAAAAGARPAAAPPAGPAGGPPAATAPVTPRTPAR
jgi:Skp family chaperone for outer membrane proteins